MKSNITDFPMLCDATWGESILMCSKLAKKTVQLGWLAVSHRILPLSEQCCSAFDDSATDPPDAVA